MAVEGSVTCWLGQLREGDPAAAQKLWERYYRRLLALARLKLCGQTPAAGDEEDVALSAFDSFCRRAENGRFPQLADRDGLWPLLVVITTRKAVGLRRHEHRQKRGGHAVAEPESLDQVLSREPSPEFAAQAVEEYQRLLRRLDDTELETVAVLKMEGHTIEEIAGQLGYAPRSIKRKLQLIRDVWEKELTA